MENKLTNEESLRIIEAMIQNSKQRYKKTDCIYFLFWGYLAIGIIGIFSLLNHFVGTPKAHFVWLLFLVGGIFNFYHAKKTHDESAVVTKVDKFISQMWQGLGMGFFVLFLGAPKLTWLMLPLSMLLMAVGAFIQGAIMDFKPFKWGAIATFMAALASFYSPQDYVIFLFIFGVLAAYIIPGHMLRNEPED